MSQFISLRFIGRSLRCSIYYMEIVTFATIVCRLNSKEYFHIGVSLYQSNLNKIEKSRSEAIQAVSVREGGLW